MKIRKLLVIILLLLPVSSIAQNIGGTLKAPTAPTPIEVRERTIQDLLYFPFSCISDPMTTREMAWQVVSDILAPSRILTAPLASIAAALSISLIVVLPSAFVTIVGMATGLGITSFSARKTRQTNSTTTWSKTFKM